MRVRPRVYTYANYLNVMQIGNSQALGKDSDKDLVPPASSSLIPIAGRGPWQFNNQVGGVTADRAPFGIWATVGGAAFQIQ